MSLFGSMCKLRYSLMDCNFLILYMMSISIRLCRSLCISQVVVNPIICLFSLIMSGVCVVFVLLACLFFKFFSIMYWSWPVKDSVPS